MTRQNQSRRPEPGRAMTGIAAVSAVIALSACSSMTQANEARKAATAEERAGRIAMVLGDEALTPDAALVGVPVVLPAPRVVSSWPQSGGGEQKVPGHVLAGDALRIAWSVDAGAGTSRSAALTAAPVTSETAVFIIDSEQNVRAFDIGSGRAMWRRELESGSRRDRVVNGGGIALDNGTLYVASGFGFVAALDASDGREVWRREFPTPIVGSPTLREGRLFVMSNSNEVYALNAQTGSIEWSDQAISESARVLGSPSPAAVEDIVVVPYSSGEVITYLASNGRRLWQDALTRTGRFTPISAINDIASRPVLSDGLVFAASQSGVLAAIDGRSGNRVWALPVGSINAPAIAGDYVYVVGVDGQVVCVLAQTGQVVWVHQLDAFSNMKKRKGRISYNGPIIASGRLIVISSEGELVALSPQTGDEVARIDLKREVFVEPIAAQGKLFVLADNGRLIAIE